MSYGDLPNLLGTPLANRLEIFHPAVRSGELTGGGVIGADMTRGQDHSKLIGNLKKVNIEINRKMLAQLAILDPEGFTKVLELAAQAK